MNVATMPKVEYGSQTLHHLRARGVSTPDDTDWATEVPACHTQGVEPAECAERIAIKQNIRARTLDRPAPQLQLTGLCARAGFTPNLIKLKAWKNNLGYDFTIASAGVKASGEVQLTTEGRCNCRVDLAAGGRKYAAAIPTSNPYHAVQFVLAHGYAVEQS